MTLSHNPRSLFLKPYNSKCICSINFLSDIFNAAKKYFFHHFLSFLSTVTVETTIKILLTKSIL